MKVNKIIMPKLVIILFYILAWTEALLYPNILYPTNINSKLKYGDKFDFIVVGSGSAGAVVVNRLTENPNWNVLVLEAGGYPSSLTDTPAFFFGIIDTAEDWGYLMERSKEHSLGLKNQVSRCPRGKVLGGTSNLNAMVYVRGNKRDFDNWEAAGNPGWDHESVIDHFRRNENVQGENIPGFGDSGYLEISLQKSQEPLRQALVNAYKEMGYKEYTHDEPMGYMDALMTISNGTRSSTAKAFISPIKERKNLHLSLYSEVSKLIIEDNKVVGVEAKINDKILKLFVRKEVILSAGSINSPKILMNSGIGPEKHLKSLGIKVIRNLRVGENLQDHLHYNLVVKLARPTVVQRRQFIEQLYDYLKFRDGEFGGIGITNFMSFVNTKNDSNFPNIQYELLLYLQGDDYLVTESSRALGYSDEITKIQMEYLKHSDNLGIIVTLLNPKSTGRVVLKSANPFDAPLIIPNYLHNEEDMEVLIEGIRLYERMLKTTALVDYKAEVVDRKIKNCRGITFGTDDYWRCYIKNIATNAFHQVGTCKMGPEDNPDSVVNARLKVHGIQGIRVIDGSIMPSITSGNTNAPIIAIGEKGSRMIMEDWLDEHLEL